MPALKKRERLKFVVEKGTELGCDIFAWIRTERSEDGGEPPASQLRSWAALAAEQCGRPTVPVFQRAGTSAAEALDVVAGMGEAGFGSVLVCVERGADSDIVEPLVEVMHALPRKDGADWACVMIGPEGGWSPAERALLEGRAEEGSVRLVSLGPSVLRAETAALAALAIIHAH